MLLFLEVNAYYLILSITLVFLIFVLVNYESKPEAESSLMDRENRLVLSASHPPSRFTVMVVEGRALSVAVQILHRGDFAHAQRRF